MQTADVQGGNAVVPHSKDGNRGAIRRRCQGWLCGKPKAETEFESFQAASRQEPVRHPPKSSPVSRATQSPPTSSSNQKSVNTQPERSKAINSERKSPTIFLRRPFPRGDWGAQVKAVQEASDQTSSSRVSNQSRCGPR